MKKKRLEKKIIRDELLPEYHLNYQKARPNRFIKQTTESSITIILDSDVAEVFKTSEVFNNALRYLLSAIFEKNS